MPKPVRDRTVDAEIVQSEGQESLLQNALWPFRGIVPFRFVRASVFAMDIICPCSFIIKNPLTAENAQDTTFWFPLAKLPFLAYRHVKRSKPYLSGIRNVVFLPVNILRKVKAASGSWVLIWKKDEKGAVPVHYAKILATDFVFDLTMSEYTSSDNVNQVAWLSPSLFSLACDADMISIETLQRRRRCTVDEFFPFTIYGRKVPTASEVVVTRVKDAKPLQEWEDLFVSFCLKKYFQRPRLLRPGEIFAILVTHELLLEWFLYSCGSENFHSLNKIDFHDYFSIDMERKIFFFRVEKLLCYSSAISLEEPAITDPEASKVSQVAGTCSKIPLDLYLFELQEHHLLEDVEILSKHSSFTQPELFQNLKLLVENHMIKETTQRIRSRSFSCSVLLHGSDDDCQYSLVQDVCYGLGLPVFNIDCLRLFGSVEDQYSGVTHMEQFLSLLHERYLEFQPCALLLRNIEALGSDLEQTNINSTRTSHKTKLLSKLEFILNDYRAGPSLNSSNTQSSSIVFASCKRKDNLHPQVRSLFIYEVEVSVPNEHIREQYLELVLRNVPTIGNNSKELAMKYSKALRSYSLKMLYFWCSQVMLNCMKKVGIEMDSRKISEEAIVSATRNMEERTNMSVIKASLRVPKITWEDIGGLSSVRELIIESIQLPLRHPELYENSAQVRRRSGLLFYGPPGTGKTLLAKAIANECGCSFLSVKGPELMNMYVGESERNIRDIFSKAREASPCVVFFDELDSLAPMRGHSSDGGGVMDRVVSQLLTEMDDLHSSDKTKRKDSLGVIVVGATNRPDLLDSALLRPGRFDKLIYIGSPETSEARFEVLSALTRNFVVSDDVNLMAIARLCPRNVSGADLYGLCADAWLFAAKRTINTYENRIKTDGKLLTSNDELQVVVCQQDFLNANSRLNPSLSEEMLLHYKQLVKRFSAGGRKVIES